MSQISALAVAEASIQLASGTEQNVIVNNLLHDDRFHALFPSFDGRTAAQDDLDHVEYLVERAKRQTQETL